VNGTAQLDGLAGLSAHLTDPGDRETYAALILYFHSLPPGDELLRLAELFGFLSLLGQRLPDALSGLLEALREQTKAAESIMPSWMNAWRSYHMQLPLMWIPARSPKP
jgi:hypothetical protein